MVYPYYAFAKANLTFTAQPSEVKEVIEVPLAEFLDEKNQTVTQMTTSYANDIQVPAYRLQGEMVWGATAMMLAETRKLMLDAGVGKALL
jgi:hypothetical protein